jgi:hypothetical protein
VEEKMKKLLLSIVLLCVSATVFCAVPNASVITTNINDGQHLIWPANMCHTHANQLISTEHFYLPNSGKNDSPSLMPIECVAVDLKGKPISLEWDLYVNQNTTPIVQTIGSTFFSGDYQKAESGIYQLKVLGKGSSTGVYTGTSPIDIVSITCVTTNHRF